MRKDCCIAYYLSLGTSIATRDAKEDKRKVKEKGMGKGWEGRKRKEEKKTKEEREEITTHLHKQNHKFILPQLKRLYMNGSFKTVGSNCEVVAILRRHKDEAG